MKPSFRIFGRRRTAPRARLRSAAALLGLSALIGASQFAQAQAGGGTSGIAFEGTHVPTQHNNNARTGVNPLETLLTPDRVQNGYTPAGGTRLVFGKMFDRKLDGDVYAQPLYVTNVPITDPETGRFALRNVVYVVTTNGTIYAWDADSNEGKFTRAYWVVNFDYPLARVQATEALDIDPNYRDFGSKLGIVGTPVIDVARQTLYVVVRTREDLVWRQRLHAFDLSTGFPKANSPILINTALPGSGDGSDFINNQLVVPFDSLFENQQAGLLVQGNNVYVAWGSHADIPPYHGWVIAYNADTLQQVGAFITTPDASSLGDPTQPGVGGGISMSGAGIAGDGSNIYVVTGNGTFDAHKNGKNYGQSVLKLRVTSAPAMSVVDYFTPFNNADLTANSIDLTTGGIVLLPTSVGSLEHPELLVAGGLEGRIYLLDRTAPASGQTTRMGQFAEDDDQQIVQSFRNAVGAIFGIPAFFNGTLYYQGSGDVMKAFTVANANITTPDVKRSREQVDYPGATPSISANGTNDGIVWTIVPSYPSTIIPGDIPGAANAVLMAHSAADVSRTLFSSQSLGSTNATSGKYTNFAVPTVANGKVFVGGTGRLTTFGMTKPQPVRASRYLITGPNYLPFIGFAPFLSLRTGYSFSITAIGPDQRPIALNTTVQLAFRTFSGSLRSGGTLTFSNQSTIIKTLAFVQPDVFEMIVTDRYGVASSTSLNIKGDTSEGTDRFVLTAKTTASPGEIINLTVRSVSASGTPVPLYDIITMPAPGFAPHPFTVYGTRVAGTQDFNSAAPGWAYDDVPFFRNRALPAPAPSSQFSDNAAFGIFESVKTVQIRMNESGDQVIVVTDGVNTGTIVIKVR